MVTRLMKHDLCEMVLEWPMPNIVKGKRTEKNNYRIDNTYLKATFEEISTPLFSIMDQHISSEEPIKILGLATIMPFGFVPLLQGMLPVVITL